MRRYSAQQVIRSSDRSYALARRAAELETTLSDEALADNEQYATVTDEFDRVESQLDELSRQFTAGDYRAEIVSLGFGSDRLRDSCAPVTG